MCPPRKNNPERVSMSYSNPVKIKLTKLINLSLEMRIIFQSSLNGKCHGRRSRGWHFPRGSRLSLDVGEMVKVMSSANSNHGSGKLWFSGGSRWLNKTACSVMSNAQTTSCTSVAKQVVEYRAALFSLMRTSEQSAGLWARTAHYAGLVTWHVSPQSKMVSSPPLISLTKRLIVE